MSDTNTPIIPMPPQHVQAYKDATDNLIFLKKQQWRVTYYSLLVQGGLLFLFNEASTSSPKAFVGMLTLATAALSVCFLVFLQASIMKMRDRLAALYDVFFSQKERKSFRLESKAGEFFATPFMFLTFCLTCIASGVVAFVIMFTRLT